MAAKLTIFVYGANGNCHTRHTWAEVLAAIAEVPDCYCVCIAVGVGGTVQVHVR